MKRKTSTTINERHDNVNSSPVVDKLLSMLRKYRRFVSMLHNHTSKLGWVNYTH